MASLHDFDSIRPYAPEELPAAFEALLRDADFLPIVQQLLPGATPEALKQQVQAIPDSLTFQRTLIYPLLKRLEGECTGGIAMNAEALTDHAGSYTFISNHRDIVLDSAFLSIMLIEGGFRTTVEIAIGDNLLIHPWIERLVRINKSFIVRRSLPLRETLAASKLMSRYMHFALTQKHENIWIAQREGRAKNSDDRTQEAVLKMMAMGGEGTPLESLREMNLVPTAIHYEYDPCDYLKAKEMQQKRDDSAFRKSRADDLQNMQTGIFGQKGRVRYHLCAPVNTWIDSLGALPKGEFFAAVAQGIDRAIHAGYELFPVNYAAADLLHGTTRYATQYSAKEKSDFEEYLQSRIALIDLPQRDEPFLRARILEMYANPALNQAAVTTPAP